MADTYSPAWPHSAILEVFPDTFYVVGTNITTHNNVELQHSRNMIIIRDKGKLSLINTVRLDDNGLSELDALGTVENVVRIGSFHGRDDAFYMDRYPAKLWALEGMHHQNNRATDICLTSKGEMPFTGCSLIVFETSQHPEGILHLDREGGILITCDSIKNWEAADAYFSAESAKLYEAGGLFGTATISNVWKEACKVQPSDFEKLKALKFKHLLSAHGDPLLNSAYEAVCERILSDYGV
jgi:hypothetical protein